MNVTVKYQDLPNSKWMNKFVSKGLRKLDPLLSDSSDVNLWIKPQKNSFETTLYIHDKRKDYSFHATGVNMTDSISDALHKAKRTLSERKRMIKDHINKRYRPLKEVV